MERQTGSATDMIDLGFIIDSLRAKHYGMGEEVEIAKGKYHLISNMRQAMVQIVRAWQRRKL
jgi:hypothetical protein